MFLAEIIIPKSALLFATIAEECSKSFLGLKTWFAYFPDDWIGSTTANDNLGACAINNNFQLLGDKSGLLLIGLAILDDLIRIAALVAVGFIVYGGIQYITSQGAPDATSKAQQTVLNALIGLVIAVLAATFVSFIGKTIAG